MKYCEDCKWCKYAGTTMALALCSNKLSLENGEHFKSALLARTEDGECGPEGKLWEAKDAV